MILIIDDDEIMAECIARACNDQANDQPNDQSPGRNPEIQIYSNAITAAQNIYAPNIPELIFLDILLDGPDGFTLLNELQSYPDTAAIPIVIVSSLDLAQWDLSAYGVVGILNKATMRPEEIKEYVRQYCRS